MRASTPDNKFIFSVAWHTARALAIHFLHASSPCLLLLLSPFAADEFPFAIVVYIFSPPQRQKQKEREVRLLMLGLDNAGKTTVVKKFNGEDIDEISPTLGFNIKTLEYRGYKLNIWDIGGQTSLRSYWRNYFEQTDGLIWVVDSADRARLQDCRAELQVLLQQERLAGASLLVFANKQDIEGALTAEQIREELGLDALTATKRHWRIEACSAFTGAGLPAGVDWIVGDISSRIFMYD